MKKLFIIGGTMGVGKTTVCQILKKKLNNTVFLDGDWCWDASPFVVNDETKEMVIDNICHLLNNFLSCSVYENVILCWVMHHQSIIDTLLSKIDTSCCEVKLISLVCSPKALAYRLNKDIEAGKRQKDIIDASIVRLPLYDSLNTIKVDVTNLNPQQAADIIAEL